MSSQPQPLVSLGIPVYNGENYLAEALDSIVNQTYPHLEIIISDNGSTDRTEEICRAFAARDGRIQYHRQADNQGATWNFNQVLRLSTGKYFKWAAHDDLLAPTLIEKCVAVLESQPDVILCHSRVEVIDQHGRFKHEFDISLKTDAPSPPTRFYELLVQWNMYYEIFGLIRRDAFEQVGLMGNFSHADGILLEKLSLIGRFHQLDEILFYPRMHEQQSIQVHGLNYQSYTSWFDPKFKGIRVFPYWRQLKEHLTTVTEAPIAIAEKVSCYAAIGYWLIKRRRELLRDLLAAQK